MGPTLAVSDLAKIDRKQKELDRLIFTDEAGTKLYFEIQEINRIKDGKGISYGVSEREVQNYESADMTEIVKKTRKNMAQSQNLWDLGFLT